MEGENVRLAKVLSSLIVFITVHDYRQRFFHFSGEDSISLDKNQERGDILWVKDSKVYPIKVTS